MQNGSGKRGLLAACKHTSSKQSSVPRPFLLPSASHKRATSCHQNRRAALRTASKPHAAPARRAHRSAAEQQKRPKGVI